MILKSVYSNIVGFKLTKTWPTAIWRSVASLTNAEIRLERNTIFNKEQQRQKGLVTRVEKINVDYVGSPENASLIMNKHESTPYLCALHMNETVANRNVVAEVNGKIWDMHRPLVQDCTLKFLTFRDDDPYQVNKVVHFLSGSMLPDTLFIYNTAEHLFFKAFWRSCSFMLGMIIEKAFKDEFYVELHSWPKPNVFSGSYVYDVDLKIDDWVPSEEELRTLTTMMQKLSVQKLKFERLDVESSVALKMFEKNRFKKAQISLIAESTNNIITLYRVGDHIDMSIGPMISNTSHLGRNAVASVHRVEGEDCRLYRFQGVAVPVQLPLNFYAFGLLVERAQELNTGNLDIAKPEEAVN